MANPKVLVFIDWYSPGFKAGGPIQSMVNMMEQMKHELDFHVLTANHDYNDNSVYDLQPREWVSRKEAQVMYLDAQGEKEDFIRQKITEVNPDTIYVNGIFSRIYSRLPLKIAKQLGMEERLVVAPRGMLAEGARSIKPLKKSLFFTLQKATSAYKNIHFHASSEQEKDDISRVIGGVKGIDVIENLPRLIQPLNSRHSKIVNELKIICLSRISPEKNIHFAIEQLSTVNTDYHIQFDIYGSVNDHMYMANCEKEVTRLPEHVEVKFNAPIEGDQLKGVFSESDLFYLPTLGENYGHAIVESLAFSCPVLISDKTPWKKLDQDNAGFDLSLNNESGFTKKIEELAAMGEEEYISFRNGARKYFELKVDSKKLKKQYLNLFSN